MEQARAKILVVDDTKTNIEVLEGVLSVHYDVFVAKNGRKAIEIAEKVHPDLILLDVMMPEMNGYETMRVMRAHSRIAKASRLGLTWVLSTTSANRLARIWCSCASRTSSNTSGSATTCTTLWKNVPQTCVRPSR